ncbi:unknown [Sutterella sp. CAG:351]|nr:unknown [Sutterella sp. CAG:351]
MDNAGARQHPEFRITEKKTVQQRVVPVPCRRMNNEAGRLIHYDDRVILVRHVKRDIRGGKSEFLRGRLRGHRDHVSLIDRIPHLIDRFSIYRNRALLDPRLETGARNFRHQGCECLIEPLPGVFR